MSGDRRKRPIIDRRCSIEHVVQASPASDTTPGNCDRNRVIVKHAERFYHVWETGRPWDGGQERLTEIFGSPGSIHELNFIVGGLVDVGESILACDHARRRCNRSGTRDDGESRGRHVGDDIGAGADDGTGGGRPEQGADTVEMDRVAIQQAVLDRRTVDVGVDSNRRRSDGGHERRRHIPSVDEPLGIHLERVHSHTTAFRRLPGDTEAATAHETHCERPGEPGRDVFVEQLLRLPAEPTVIGSAEIGYGIVGCVIRSGPVANKSDVRMIARRILRSTAITVVSGQRIFSLNEATLKPCRADAGTENGRGRDTGISHDFFTPIICTSPGGPRHRPG